MMTIQIDFQIINSGETTDIPLQKSIPWGDSIPWWETTMLDADRDGVHDSLADETGIVNIGISYSRDVRESDIDSLSLMGININLELPSVDSLLIGGIHVDKIEEISNLDGVVMIERYGSVVFYGDIQTTFCQSQEFFRVLSRCMGFRRKWGMA